MLCIAAIYTVCSRYIENSSILVLISLILLGLFTFYMYVGRVLNKIITTILFWMLINTLDMLVYFGLVKILNFSPKEWLATSYNQVFVSIVCKLILLLCLVIIKKLWDIKHGNFIMKMQDFIYLIFYPLLSILSVVVLAGMYDQSERVYDGVVLYCFVLFIVNLGMIWMVNTAAKNRKSEQDTKILAEQVKYSEQEIGFLTEAQRKLRAQAHDFKKHLNTLSVLLKANSVEEAKVYIEKVLDNTLMIAAVVDSGNSYCDAILNHYYTMMIRENINVNLEIDNLQHFNTISPNDLVIILGNTVDNAYEASIKNCNEREIHITIKFREGQFIYSISNLVDEPHEVDFSRTSKISQLEKHGYGLSNVISTLEKYSGIYDITFQNHIVTFIALISTN